VRGQSNGLDLPCIERWVTSMQLRAEWTKAKTLASV